MNEQWEKFYFGLTGRVPTTFRVAFSFTRPSHSDEWKFLIYFSPSFHLLTVAKVIETVAAAAVAAAAQKTSTSKASIVVSAHQPSTMTSIATSITPSSNSNHTTTTAVSLASVVKKQRPKTSSPTRHGPQQCQVSFDISCFPLCSAFPSRLSGEANLIFHSKLKRRRQAQRVQSEIFSI